MNCFDRSSKKLKDNDKIEASVSCNPLEEEFFVGKLLAPTLKPSPCEERRPP